MLKDLCDGGKKNSTVFITYKDNENIKGDLSFLFGGCQKRKVKLT